MKYILFILCLAFSSNAIAQSTNFFKVIGNDSADRLEGSVQLTNGDYFILSNTNTAAGQEFQITKTDGLGSEIWSRTYGTSGSDEGFGMAKTSDDGVVVCGVTNGAVSGLSDEDGFITKLSSSGAITWTRYLRTDTTERLLDVIQGRFGDYYTCGYTTSDSLDLNMIVTKITSSGAVSWSKSLGGKGDDIAYSLAQDGLGRIVVVGSTENDSVTIGGVGDKDISIVILNQGGLVLESKNFGSISSEEAKRVEVVGNKIYVGGNTNDGQAGGQDVFICEFDTNLVVQNNVFYGTFGDDEFQNMFLIPNSNPRVIYSAPTFNSQRDLLLTEVNFLNPVGANAGVIGGFGFDGLGKASMMGDAFIGYSVVSGGVSFGRKLSEDIYITRLDNNFSLNCGFGSENIIGGTLTFQSDLFQEDFNSGSVGSFPMRSSTIKNSDTTICCSLQARVAQDTITICDGQSTSLGRRSISGYVYTWASISGEIYTGSTADPTVSPSVTTEYKLVVTSPDGKCVSDSAQVYVRVNPRQSIPLLKDTVGCSGSPLTISAQSGLTFYQWTNQNGQVVNTANYTTSAADTLYLQMLDDKSCIFNDTVAITFQSLPRFSLGSDTTICENLDITLTGPADMSNYNWNGVDGSDSTFTTNIQQSHILIVTDSAGCIFSDTLQLLTNPSSTFTLGEDTAICAGDNISIFIPSALRSYSWNGQPSADFEFVVSSAGTYIGSALNSFDCPASDTIVITELAVPSFSLGNDTGFCDVVSIQLAGPISVSSYEWNDGSGNPLLNVTDSGTYSLKVTDANMCSFTDTIFVDLYQSPSIDLGPDTIIPQSGVLVLSAGEGFASYDWSDGSTSSSIQVTDTGIYSVTVTDENGCTGSDEVRVPKTANISYLDGVKYTLYPNPAQTKFYVKTEGNISNSNLELYDATGRMVLSQAVESLIPSMDVSELESGIYKLILTSDETSLPFTVIVSH